MNKRWYSAVFALAAAAQACGGTAQTADVVDASADADASTDARETGLPPYDAPGEADGNPPDAAPETSLEVCSDGVDNDANGETDCQDAACFAACGCYLVERCGNGADDDCDGLVDCADPACSHDACCADPAKPSPEDCSNGVDDDCDGAVDCVDPDRGAAHCCAGAPTPEPTCPRRPRSNGIRSSSRGSAARARSW